ncbi:AraC family transcriptional regulator [Paenibacillus sp. CF384]|uniref:AraC family transcriptional regulator n=1 Tax=Paenibacillus sp. CF384 TaxID=1884382 RepID=UPI00089874F0|nr:AraC family transcriptional regulator [Paenibacillus sp. CF384]SDW90398.1 AraC-like ligand binding domain-containing protein [Paenibacillus sp. CF384]
MSLRLVMQGQSFRPEHVTTDRQQGRKGMLTTRHQHPVFHVMYITGGAGSFLVNDKKSRALPGFLYVINPNEWHQFHADDDIGLHNLECTFLLRDEESNEPAKAVNLFDWIEEKSGYALPAVIRDGPILVPPALRPFLLEGFNRLLDPSNRYVTAEHLSLLVIELMLRVEQTIGKLSERVVDSASTERQASALAGEINALQQYMRAHIGEQLKLEELAHYVHWTPNYLCRVFKAHTSMTPMAYLQQLRMAEAEKLLLYTDFPVFTIAEMLGYEDASYFARLFRRHHGRAPSEYRII